MSGWYKKVEIWVTRIVVGTFMPDLGKQMEQEGLFNADELPECLLVEDNGADLTIFSFSGFDVLFAGLARYEFRSALKAIGQEANYVFIRDIHRTGFHMTPDGKKGGVAYYEAEVDRLKKELGASRNVAVGSSSGGSAAIYFAAQCRLEEAVVFGALLDLDTHDRWANVFKTVIKFKLLMREPAAYFESLVVMLGGRWGLSKVKREVGFENLMQPLEAFQASGENAPKITYYYGAQSYTDALQAKMIVDHPAVRVVPLPTGRHNTPSYLKQRGQLSMAIGAAISDTEDFDAVVAPANPAAGTV